MRDSLSANYPALGMLIGMVLGSVLGAILYLQTGQALYFAVMGLSTAFGLSIGAALQPAPCQVVAQQVR